MVYHFRSKTRGSKFTHYSIDMIKRFVIIALGWHIATAILAFVVLVCQSVYQAMVLGAGVEHVCPEPKVLAMGTVLTTLEIMAFYWLIRVKKDRKQVGTKTGDDPSITSNEAPQLGSSRSTTSTEIPCDQIDIATTLSQFPEIESADKRPGNRSGPIFSIKLKKNKTLPNGAAGAIIDISTRFRNAGKWCSFVIESLTVLSDSPEHVKLASLLYESQKTFCEDVDDFPSWYTIELNGLERITPAIARVFTECSSSSHHLQLNGIRELLELVAYEFQAFSLETLELNGLVEISSSVAGKICGDGVANLSLDGIKTLNLEAAEAFAERFQGESISMWGLVDLAPEVAKVLAEANFTVVLSGSALEEFDKHR